MHNRIYHLLQHDPHLLPKQVWEPKSFPQRAFFETGWEGDGVEEDERVDVDVDRVELELERVDVELDRVEVTVDNVLLRCVDVDPELLR